MDFRLQNATLTDVWASLAGWRRWLALARYDLRARNRRSVLGSYWVTITNGLMLAVIGTTYGWLWNGHDPGAFLPFLGVSYLVWQFLSTLLNEASDAYSEAAPFIQNFAGPKLFWVLRTLARNVMAAGYMVPIVLVLVGMFRFGSLEGVLVLPAAGAVFVGECLGLASIVAACSTRFRDVKRLVGLLLSAVFLVTPILWRPQALAEHAWLYELNPFFHMLELVRRPLLGDEVTAATWAINAGLLALLWLLALLLHRSVVRRVFYWL